MAKCLDFRHLVDLSAYSQHWLGGKGGYEGVSLYFVQDCLKNRQILLYKNHTFLNYFSLNTSFFMIIFSFTSFPQLFTWLIEWLLVFGSVWEWVSEWVWVRYSKCPKKIVFLRTYFFTLRVLCLVNVTVYNGIQCNGIQRYACNGIRPISGTYI